MGHKRKVHDESRRLVVVPLRAGYVYEKSPVPDQTGINNLVDADRHTLTVGLGVELNRPFPELGFSLTFDGHGMFSFLPERQTLKANPADFVGDYSANGNIYGGGGTMGVQF